MHKKGWLMSQIVHCGPQVSQRVNSWRSENEGSGPPSSKIQDIIINRMMTRVEQLQ